MENKFWKSHDLHFFEKLNNGGGDKNDDSNDDDDV
jgi:hypothetical protein